MRERVEPCTGGMREAFATVPRLYGTTRIPWAPWWDWPAQRGKWTGSGQQNRDAIAARRGGADRVRKFPNSMYNHNCVLCASVLRVAFVLSILRQAGRMHLSEDEKLKITSTPLDRISVTRSLFVLRQSCVLIVFVCVHCVLLENRQDHTADIQFHAWGSSLAEAFEQVSPVSPWPSFLV